MGPLQAELPWPPSVNHYWGTRDVVRYISPRARAWLDEAIILLRAVKPGREPLKQPVALFLIAYPPDRRKRDMDNILKPILDALVKSAVIGDDSQVHELHLVRRPPDGQGGRVRLVLEAL